MVKYHENHEKALCFLKAIVAVAAASSATCHKSLWKLRQQRAFSYQLLSARALLPGSIVAGGGAFILITSFPVYVLIRLWCSILRRPKHYLMNSSTVCDQIWFLVVKLFFVFFNDLFCELQCLTNVLLTQNNIYFLCCIL